MRTSYSTAFRRRREAARATTPRLAAGEVFGFALTDGALYRGAAYHAACAPADADRGVAWDADDTTRCPGCGGPVGQAPAVRS